MKCYDGGHQHGSWPTHPLYLSLSPPPLSLSSLSHTHTHSLSLSLTHSLTHPLSHSLTHSLSLSLSLIAAVSVVGCCVLFPSPQVRHYVYQQLAKQLRPELEAVMKANDVPAGTPYVFNAQESGRRFVRNFAESILGALDDAEVQERLLRRCVGVFRGCRVLVWVGVSEGLGVCVGRGGWVLQVILFGDYLPVETFTAGRCPPFCWVCHRGFVGALLGDSSPRATHF